MDFSCLELGPKAPEPTTWVAFEATTQPKPFRPRRRKAARGKAKVEAAEVIESRGKSRGHQNLRPDQIEALRLKREPKDHSVVCLEQEDGEGSVEYKFRIRDPHPVRLQQLITQMKYRLSEGNGECFYYIGVEDNGYPKGLEPADLDASISTLHVMAASLGAAACLLQLLPGAWGRRAALLRVATRTAEEAVHTDLRIAVAGSADAGKSTLVAVLTHGSAGRPLLDNGRGLARMAVFRHKHEMQSGRTSSICHQLLGYDGEGRVINYVSPAATGAALTPAEITGSAAKVLTFLDMGGHEKYLKTALYGMTALLPDYGLLCCCGAAGLGRVAREHLAVAVALEVPVAVVITKVELLSHERLAAVVAEVRELAGLALQHEAGRALAPEDAQQRVKAATPLVSTEAEAQEAARVLGQLHADALAAPVAGAGLRIHMPIFAVSAVTGAGLPVLHVFLNALQPACAAVKSGAAAAAAVAAAAATAAVEDGVDGPDGSGGGGRGASLCGADSNGCAGFSSDVSSSMGGSPRASARASSNALDAPFTACPQDGPITISAAAPAGPPLYASELTSQLAASADGGGVPYDAAHADAVAVHFQVDGTFDVEGVGCVVSGTVVSGTVRLGQRLMLGPTAAGDFAPVLVRQLQRSHVHVQQVRAGQTCTIAISHADAAAHGWPPAAAHGGGPMLPLGTSPGAAGGAMGAAAALAAIGTGRAAAIAAAPTKLDPGEKATGADGAACFDDALAAAQTALELCLACGDSDGGGGGGDDDLFAFDAPDSPAPPPPQLAHGYSAPPGAHMPAPPSPASTQYGSSFGGGTYSMAGACAALGLPASASVSQLHSTISFSAATNGGGGIYGGVGGADGMSSSAPVHRTRSVPAAVGAAGGGGGLSATPTSRRVSVLLGPAFRPQTSWTFEAVLVLLGGQWPPRGLVSGRWPPLGVEETSAGAAEQAQSGRGGSDHELRTARAEEGQEQGVLEAAAGSLYGAASRARPPSSGSGSEHLDSGRSVGRGDSNGAGGSSSDVPDRSTSVDAEAATLAAAEAPDGGARPRRASGTKAARRRGRASSAGGGGKFVTVVHCGSVRQAAQVLVMQELLEAADGEGAAAAAELRISASTRAAAALLHSAATLGHGGHPQALAAAADAATVTKQHVQAGVGVAETAAGSAGAPASPRRHPDLGCLVRVVLRWQHRPEWLREGAKLLVRDRSDGRVAGAGFVKRVLM